MLPSSYMQIHVLTYSIAINVEIDIQIIAKWNEVTRCLLFSLVLRAQTAHISLLLLLFPLPFRAETMKNYSPNGFLCLIFLHTLRMLRCSLNCNKNKLTFVLCKIINSKRIEALRRSSFLPQPLSYGFQFLLATIQRCFVDFHRQFSTNYLPHAWCEVQYTWARLPFFSNATVLITKCGPAELHLTKTSRFAEVSLICVILPYCGLFVSILLSLCHHSETSWRHKV